MGLRLYEMVTTCTRLTTTKAVFHSKVSIEQRMTHPHSEKKKLPMQSIILKYRIPYIPLGAKYDKNKNKLASWKYKWLIGSHLPSQRKNWESVAVDEVVELITKNGTIDVVVSWADDDKL